MESRRDRVFLLEDEAFRTLPARPLQEGLPGRNLEDALQTLIADHPEILPGDQIDPCAADPPKFAPCCA